MRAIIGPVQQPNFEIVEPNLTDDQRRRFGNSNVAAATDSNSDDTGSTRDDATLSEAPPSTSGWSNDSFDTMYSNKNTSRPPIDTQYVANLLDYKHVVSVLEQPVCVIIKPLLESLKRRDFIKLFRNGEKIG